MCSVTSVAGLSAASSGHLQEWSRQGGATGGRLATFLGGAGANIQGTFHGAKVVIGGFLSSNLDTPGSQLGFQQE